MSGMIQDANGTWCDPPGYEALWNWFGLSYASWLTLPRVLMHEMPDDWQARMAALLDEYDAYWNLPDCGYVSVSLKKNGKFASMPHWLAYKHPDIETINSFKATP